MESEKNSVKRGKMGAAKKLDPKSGKVSTTLTELKAELKALSTLKKPSEVLKKFAAKQKLGDVDAYLKKEESE